jgi:hypothetical protein
MIIADCGLRNADDEEVSEHFYSLRRANGSGLERFDVLKESSQLRETGCQSAFRKQKLY